MYPPLIQGERAGAVHHSKREPLALLPALSAMVEHSGLETPMEPTGSGALWEAGSTKSRRAPYGLRPARWAWTAAD